MSIFKKKNPIEGQILDVKEEEVQKIIAPSQADSEIDSALYSELEENDRMILDLQNSLIQRYKNTPVVENLNIETLPQLNENEREREKGSMPQPNPSTLENSDQKNINFSFNQQQQFPYTTPKEFSKEEKRFDYKGNKELVFYIVCLKKVLNNFVKENEKQARDYLSHRIYREEFKKQTRFLLAKKKILEEKKKEIKKEDLNKYNVENLEKVLKRMGENLDRVTGKNSQRLFIKEVEEKSQDYNKRNEKTNQLALNFKRNLEEMNEKLLNIVVDK